MWYVCITYGNNVTIMFCFCSSLWRIFLLHHNYAIYLFDVVTFFHDARITFYFGMFALHIEITLQLRFAFVRYFDVFFIFLQLRYLFVRYSYVFYDIRITLYFGRFELRMMITLQLRFVFVRHCDVSFIT